ncbi:MAG: hypothetical protein OEU92_22635 [Alphaproteobacteria bacterium]|nr:hypothetical protein [Alphaproteobacteria bacterium]
MLKLSIPVLITIFLSASFAQADQYNQPRHMKVGSKAKISRVIAKSKTLQGQTGGNSSGTPACGEERDGVIIDRGVGKEKIVVVTKDIINTGGNVEIGRDCK